MVLHAPLQAAGAGDLFDLQKLSKKIKATELQKTALTAYVAQLRELVIGYQITRAKQLCEATLWQGHIPKIKALRSLRKATLDSVHATLELLKQSAQLNNKQTKSLDKLLKGDKNSIDYPLVEHPYYHINNSPLMKKFSREKHAYQITLPSQPSHDNTWTYAQLLETWTARGFIPTISPIDDVRQAPNIAGASDVQTRILPTSQRGRIVKSPLIIAATLLVPDLAKAEFDLLKANYAADSVEVSTWSEYYDQNQLAERIQVRLKLNTPFNEKYLDLKRWIIFLEDGEGIGYEPLEIQPSAFYPLEAVQVSLPGQEIEVTDIFGQYISPIPGDKGRFYLDAPSEITYVGNEKLLKLYFPGRDFQGKPLVNEKTELLKLIVQSQETDFGRSELIWHIKKPKTKVRPPKG
jgi:hypothetical protein